VVDFPSDLSLKVQLQQKYSSGIEIEAWSLLPHGSGLGRYFPLNISNRICKISSALYVDVCIDCLRRAVILIGLFAIIVGLFVVIFVLCVFYSVFWTLTFFSVDVLPPAEFAEDFGHYVELPRD